MAEAKLSDHLPRSLRPIAKVIGEQKCLALVTALGGTMVYVSKTPKDNTLLTKAIGPTAAKKLAAAFAGTHLDLPVSGKAVTLWLANQGLSNNEIARRQHISAHTVGRRLNKSAASQLDLFKLRDAS